MAKRVLILTALKLSKKLDLFDSIGNEFLPYKVCVALALRKDDKLQYGR